jgi:hypothetical protein
MAYQGIGTGTTPNDNSGDSLLTGAVKINSNFTEIYNALGGSSGTIPITVSVVGSALRINVVGVGSTSFNLS